MAAVINTNYLSLVAQNNLNKSQSALGTAIERLSSGLRINSAKDDAAGMAIANRFTANVKGLTKPPATPTTASRWLKRPKARRAKSTPTCSACANWPFRPVTATTRKSSWIRCKMKSTSACPTSTASRNRPTSTA